MWSRELPKDWRSALGLEDDATIADEANSTADAEAATPPGAELDDDSEATSGAQEPDASADGAGDEEGSRDDPGEESGAEEDDASEGADEAASADSEPESASA